VRTGRWASIVPQPWIETLGPPAGVITLPLDQPHVRALIALVTTKAEPGSPVIRELIRAARDTGIREALDGG
ncbi:LysR family transcriptional regulator, partial [Mycobacterium sp. Lab-001]